MNGSKTLVELKYNELNVRMPSFRCTHGERNGRGGSECWSGEWEWKGHSVSYFNFFCEVPVIVILLCFLIYGEGFGLYNF